MLTTKRNVAFFLISSMVLGLLHQLQIFSQLHLIELLGLLTSQGLFLLYINDLPDDVICNIAIYADDTTLYSKSDQASDL